MGGEIHALLINRSQLNPIYQTRVYYVNEKMQLQEACWTDGFNENKWYRGALNTLKLKATADSLLTAAVDDHFMKVFYVRDDGDGPELWVAWVVTGEEAWSTRGPVATF